MDDDFRAKARRQSKPPGVVRPTVDSVFDLGPPDPAPVAIPPAPAAPVGGLPPAPPFGPNAAEPATPGAAPPSPSGMGFDPAEGLNRLLAEQSAPMGSPLAPLAPFPPAPAAPFMFGNDDPFFGGADLLAPPPAAAPFTHAELARVLGGAGADAPATSPPSFAVPAYKNQIVRQGTMDHFLAGHGDAPPNLRNAMGEIFAAEGGFLPDPLSSAFAGITDGALAEARKFDPSLASVARAKDMTEDQVIRAYRATLHAVLGRYGGAQALETIPEAATAAALADTLFVHGGDGGARIIRDATNAVTETMPPFVQDQLAVSVLPPSGAGQAPGPEDTLDVLRRLDAGGFGGIWRNVVADFRIRAVPRGSMDSRINHFRF